MELRRLTQVIWRRLWLILLAVVFTAGGTYALSISMIPAYASFTILQIEQGTDPRTDPYTSILTSERTAATYVVAMKAGKVLDEVIAGLGLPFSAGRLASMIKVEQVKNTQVLRLTVEDVDPVRAKEIASKLVEVFLRQNAERQEARFEAGKKDLEGQIASLEKDIETNQMALVSLGDPMDPKNVKIPDYVRLERTRLETILSRDQTRYSMLLKSREDFRLAAAQYVDSITVLSPPEVSRSPVRPRTLLNTVVGTVAGLFLGVSGAFLLEYLDDTVKMPEDVERELGLITLGVIGRIAGLKSLKDTLAAAWTRRSSVGEGYRTLRTNLQFASLSNPAAALLVTSSSLEEGKSTTVVNLGVSLARAGKKVILVDADLRRPSLDRFFEQTREPGLTNLLLGEGAGLKEILRETGIENLRLLTCGPVPPNPSELLGSEAMARLIEEMKGEAEAVIFDSPPVLVVSDATVLGGQVGRAILVLDSGRTRVEMARRSKHALEQAGVKLIGAVLNRQRAGRAGYYYYYHRYYAEDRTKSDG